MRDEPLLLVLDEPTAALDAETEHALFERYAAGARGSTDDGRITVLVSHRFSTVRMADLIVVLDGARVAEVGSHDELMARPGPVRRAVRHPGRRLPVGRLGGLAPSARCSWPPVLLSHRVSAAGLGVGGRAALGGVQGREHAAGGEVGGPLVDLLDAAELVAWISRSS